MPGSEISASSARYDKPFAEVRAIRRPALQVAILVFAGYYLGSRIGFALTFLPSPISVLWPPNAILFAALLLVPRERWWLVIAAALPAHLLAQLQSAVPLQMVLCWFVSNLTEALIGATCTRWLVGKSGADSHLVNIVAFLIAAFFAIFISSFIDSAFVVLNGWGERTYWELWETRLFSNLTAAITLVPLIVLWASGAFTPLRLTDPWRSIEAVALLAVLIATTTFAFDSDVAKSAPNCMIYLPLPVVLWAALRFGLVGASTAFAVVAFLVIWATGHALGPFGTSSVIDDTRSVQLFVIFVAPTLLCLAAVLEDRRHAEQTLRVGERRFQFVLEATRDTVYERELATDKLWWSGTALTQFGYGERDRPRSFSTWLNLIHPEDRERACHENAEFVASSARRRECEFRLRRADSSYAQVHEQGFIVRDDRGKPIQMIATLTDITERRDVDELRHKLAQAAHLTAIGELTASIAHEINQPMSAILSNVDAAEMLLDGGNSESKELRDILNDIRNDDLRASEVIRHIRGFANKQRTDFEAFPINDLVLGVMRLLASTAQRRKIELTADFGAVPFAYGDRIHVQQVLLNLMLNGMDAMSAVPEETRLLRIATASHEAHTVEISVSDAGHGIAPVHLDRIFDSFFTTKRDGMGLGLSIARSLIDAHGGRIWAENNPYVGATFRFTLPTATTGKRTEPDPRGAAG